jgi:hypothetical protein
MPSASGLRPDVHLTLSDGAVTLGFILANISGLRQLPRGVGAERKSLSQKTWTGGRGNRRYSEDTTRFYDSGFLWSLVDKQLTPGPLYRHTTGYRFQHLAMPGSVSWHALTGSQTYLARQVTPLATFASVAVYLIVRRIGDPGPLTIEWCNEAGGDPGTVLATKALTIGDVTDWLSQFKEAAWGSSQAAVAASNYWIKVYDPTGTTADHWEIGVDAAAAGKKSADGSSWTTAAGLHYRLVDADPAWDSGFFFEYKRGWYFCTQPRTGSSQVYLNGDRGLATGSQSTTMLVDTTKSWATNKWAGCVVLRSDGEHRRIVSNSGDTLILDRAWNAAPASGVTEYNILGSEDWQALTITLSGVVTDYTEANGVFYFALGDTVNIRRYREYNNAGVWARENADDGTNKATFVETLYDASGVLSIYKCSNDTVTFAKAPAVTWPTDLTFGTTTQVGSTDTRFTSLTEYTGLWFGKEDAIFALEGSTLINKIPQLKDVRDEANGRNMRAWNTNLYWPFLSGWERTYQSTTDDIGPNRGTGMPAGRSGRVTDWTTILHRAAIAYDADAAGTSSILITTYPGGDWHEVYRAPKVGRRITTVAFQSLPDVPNRLWFCEGGDLMYLYLPDDVLNPVNDPAMRYIWEGYLTMAWIDLDTPELEHFWHLLRLFTENLSTTYGRRIEVDYQLDGATDASRWQRMSQSFIISPVQVEPVGGGHVAGWRIRFRLRLLTETAETPPIVQAIEVRANTLGEPLTDFILDIQKGDRMMLIGGAEDRDSAQKALNQLALWQISGYPLSTTSVLPFFDGWTGHIDPVSVVTKKHEDNTVSLVGSITFKANSQAVACTLIPAGEELTIAEGSEWFAPGCLTLDGVLTLAGVGSLT